MRGKAKTTTKALPDTYRTPKGGKTTRRTSTGTRVATRRKLQTGQQTRAGGAEDRQTKARYPGRRVSAAGTKYSETRRNRSDASKVRKR